MIVKNPTTEQLEKWNSNLNKYIKQNFEFVETKYVDLGSKIVRILNYSKDFKPLYEKQLTFSLKDNSDHYDATIVLWNEKDVGQVAKYLDEEFDPKKNFKLRIELLYSQQKHIPLVVFDETYSNIYPLIEINPYVGFVNSYDKNTNTYYYAFDNLEPEEFIKQGHIFVQMFNKILRDKNSNLVHGAVVGMNNNGILFCARGQRGKSTLTVLSMMEGFEYVSDDYLVLEQENDNLYSHPIYSIITLSPRMYNELYDRLEGCRFVSNNARKDKYVVNISKFHPQFKKKYPIKVCIFPEIVSDPEPSIRLCNSEEKGRAITQLIQSTVSQMQDTNSHETILKLLNMVKDFEFYKLNLCNNIVQNTEYLKDFISKYEVKKSTVPIDRMLVDITFDIANVLDSKTGTIYTMNKFATNVYENLVNGVNKNEIIEFLESKIGPKYKIRWQIEKFVEELNNLELLAKTGSCTEININPEFVKEDKCLLSIIKYDTKENIELIKEKENELCIK